MSKLLLLGITLVACLLVGEIVTRLLCRKTMVMYPRYHTEAKYGDYRLRRMRPGAHFWHRSIDGRWEFRINKQGYRSDRDYTYAKPSGTLRAIVLGDSQTQGYEVDQDEMFSAVAERYLTTRGVKAEVLNFGVSGFGTAEELAFLENEGFRYHPDYVVVGFFSNDFADNVKSGLFSFKEGRLVAEKKEHLPGVRIQNFIYRLPFVQFLSEHSYLYSLAFNTAWIHFKQALYSREKAEALTEYAVQTENASDYETRLGTALIKRMHEWCRTNNARLIVVDIPQIAPPDPRDYRTSAPQPLGDLLGQNVDIFIGCDEVLQEYRGVATFHVAHGSRHISAFTHMLYGIAIGNAIIGDSKIPHPQTIGVGAVE